MRFWRDTTHDLAWPSLCHTRGWFLGLPFVLTACLPVFSFGWQAGVTGLAVAGVASFVVFLPLAALALNGGDALSEEEPMPPLTTRCYIILLALWTSAAWFGAVIEAGLG
jgi:hypothetical protein